MSRIPSEIVQGLEIIKNNQPQAIPACPDEPLQVNFNPNHDEKGRFSEGPGGGYTPAGPNGSASKEQLKKASYMGAEKTVLLRQLDKVSPGHGLTFKDSKEKIADALVKSASDTKAPGASSAPASSNLVTGAVEVNGVKVPASQTNKGLKKLDKTISRMEQGAKSPSTHSDMKAVYRQDAQDLQAVRRSIVKGDYKTAANLARQLDTAVRDKIPEELYAHINVEPMHASKGIVHIKR